MISNTSFQDIWKLFSGAKRVAMSLHSSPDGDSLGSCTALKYVLERDFNIKVDLVSYDSLPHNLMNLNISREVNFDKDISELEPSAYDFYVFLDTSSLGYISGKLNKAFSLPNSTKIIVFDHHITHVPYGTYTYLDVASPSTCSVLLDFFRAIGVKFDRELCSRLLLGICTDSGFFTYDSNPRKALLDGAFLVEHGADYLGDVLRPVLYTEPLKMKKYFSLLVSNLHSSGEGKYAYSFISQEDIQKLGLNEAEIRLGGNELQFIDEYEFIFTLAELSQHIKGSFRSKKGVNVSLFAKALGGGGHKSAAAFNLPSMPLSEAVKAVENTIRDVGIHSQ